MSSSQLPLTQFGNALSAFSRSKTSVNRHIAIADASFVSVIRIAVSSISSSFPANHRCASHCATSHGAIPLCVANCIASHTCPFPATSRATSAGESTTTSSARSNRCARTRRNARATSSSRSHCRPFSNTHRDSRGRLARSCWRDASSRCCRASVSSRGNESLAL